MRYVNLTAAPIQLTWCVKADHWNVLGIHTGKNKHVNKTCTVPSGGVLDFDDQALNGQAIQASAVAAGLTLVQET